jgi:hypothetical protein
MTLMFGGESALQPVAISPTSRLRRIVACVSDADRAALGRFPRPTVCS